jgi:hypothetical protein
MGDNLYGIEKKLKEENPSLKKIKLVEETLNDFIYPVDYTEEEVLTAYENPTKSKEIG